MESIDAIAFMRLDERILKYLNDQAKLLGSLEIHHTHQQIADDFQVGVATLRRWVKLQKETGSLQHKVPTVTRPRKVDYNKVQKFIEENPDKTLKEIGIAIGTKDTLYVIRKLGITYKKTLPLRGKTGRFERRISKTIKADSK